MAEVEVTINGRSYLMGCDDGQEDHLRMLAKDVSRRVDELVASVGQVGDARLLLMTSLLIADELYDLRVEGGGGTVRSGGEDHEDHSDLAERLDILAQRLEMVAAHLQGS